MDMNNNDESSELSASMIKKASKSDKSNGHFDADAMTQNDKTQAVNGFANNEKVKPDVESDHDHDHDAPSTSSPSEESNKPTLHENETKHANENGEVSEESPTKEEPPSLPVGDSKEPGKI